MPEKAPRFKLEYFFFLIFTDIDRLAMEEEIREIIGSSLGIAWLTAVTGLIYIFHLN